MMPRVFPVIVSDELLFALFHLFGDIVALEGGRPFHALDEVARREHELADDHFFHGVGVGARGVEDDDAEFCVIGVGDIVNARARTAYRNEIFVYFVVVHVCASYEYCVGIMNFIADFVFAVKHVIDFIADFV